VSGVVRKALSVIEGILRPWLQAAESVVKTSLAIIGKAWDLAFSGIKRVVTGDVDAIRTVLGWFGKIADLFRGWWDDAVRAVSGKIDDLVGFVKKIPGRVNDALGGLPGMMWNAGVHAIEKLIDGITSMFGKVGSTMSSLASKVAGFFGLSPAKEGPLSAGGAPEIRGAHFAEALAAGMGAGTTSVAAAARRLAGAAAVSPAAGSASGSGTVTVQLQIGSSGGGGLDQLFMTWLKQNVRAAGGDPGIFNRKVQFAGG